MSIVDPGCPSTFVSLHSRDKGFSIRFVFKRLTYLSFFSQTNFLSLDSKPTDVEKSLSSSNFQAHKVCSGDNTDSTFLWRIRRKKPSFLFGTIHVPYTTVWPSIPKQVKRALNSSDKVMFELDLLDTQTELSLLQCQLLPKGLRAQELLPPQLYKRIKQHLEYVRERMPFWMTINQRVKGIHAEALFKALTSNWEVKRPFWILLMINSLTEHDIRMRGIHVLDKYLAIEAQRMYKSTGGVERVEEQCQPLNQLNATLVIFALDQALTQHESIRNGTLKPILNTDHLIHQYICGDFNIKMFDTRLASSAVAPQLLSSPSVLSNNSGINENTTTTKHFLEKELDRYFKEELILKRNVQMGRRIVTLLRENANTSFFFAFGAGHFLGNNSVVDHLRQEGIDVVRVTKSSSRRDRHKKKRIGMNPLSSTPVPFLSRVRPVFLPRS